MELALPFLCCDMVSARERWLPAGPPSPPTILPLDPSFRWKAGLQVRRAGLSLPLTCCNTLESRRVPCLGSTVDWPCGYKQSEGVSLNEWPEGVRVGELALPLAGGGTG